MRNRRWTALVLGTGLIAAGCSTDAHPGDAAVSTDLPRLEEVREASVHAADPAAIAVWASYLVDVTVVSEREVRKVDSPSASGGEAPVLAGRREVILQVDDVAWANGSAISDLAPDDTLAVTTEDGWLEQDGERFLTVGVPYPVTLEVGEEYTVAFVDDTSEDGDQVLRYLEGSTRRGPDAAAFVAAVQRESELSPPDGSNVPRLGQSFEERLAEHLGGG